jgi:lysophospholipase L1-like esterase
VPESTRAARSRRDARRIVIAAIGASDLTGEGASDPLHDNWVAQLSTRLPDDIDIQSLGVGGAWLADAYRDQIPRAIALKPDIVVGWLIVNDLTQGATLEDYLEVLESTLASLSEVGAQVVLGNAPRLWDLPAFTGEPADIEELRVEVLRWNEHFSVVARRYDATVVDLHGNPIVPEDLSPDGFHPSTAGHARLAGTFHPHVLSAIDRVRTVRLNAPDDTLN